VIGGACGIPGYPVFEGSLVGFGHGGKLGQESWFGAHGFLVARGFRAHGLHVMKPLKGLGYSIEIILEVRGEGSLGWLGRIWSRNKVYLCWLW
jgi:hypothetical protein